jgi:glyoxylase-like metal-dependent hydrolase (beta-lactamase superfamily II)
MAPTQVEAFFDPATGTVSYLAHAGRGSAAAVIDPVLDYDPKSGRTSTASADRLVGAARELALRVEWILETHAHADHLSSARYLKRLLGGRIAIGERIRSVQQLFGKIFNLSPAQLPGDGREFDHLFAPEARFKVGELDAVALAVPGHTPADMAYRIGDAVFVGDTLFMPDVGTARADFPGGDARALYRSIRKLLELAPATRLYVCHDYPPAGREPRWETTVAAQRTENIHVRDGVSEEAFVEIRTKRDATLGMPTLMLPAIQVNIRAGELPPAESNGTRYLKIPLDRF